MGIKKLFIVHCVDTEGPMFESIAATFSRLKIIFDIDIEPTEENLYKLQNRSVDLGGKEKQVANLVSPCRLNFNATWREIDLMLTRLNNDDFRYALTGDNGKPWVFTWFCLDHVGFTGNNPRNRSLGDHSIFDRYRSMVGRNNFGDSIQWHYHPLPATGNVNDSGISYLTSNNIWEILSKKIIERSWFPSAFRPGFHTIRPDSHWFLEQWIPFDYGNQSSPYEENDQPDLSDGRYGDWRRAPSSWEIYHPHHDDYQAVGSCRRWVARCMNIEARIRRLSDADIESAFARANCGEPTVLAMTNHDFRDMYAETIPVISRIRKAMLRYPDVEIIPIDAVNAMRGALGIEDEVVKLNCKVICESPRHMKLEVTALGRIFGTQPYLAIQLCGARYLWENFDSQGDGKWTFVFDENHIPANLVTAIGVAVNSVSGHTTIANYKRGQESWIYSYYEK